ncbi:MAG: tripartite tricarboxylate transporter TctB family protein [Syntrophales bacterium]|nr:tripartite tricarboxylate transporter TctB family protein [Syntrophales bacterium]
MKRNDIIGGLFFLAAGVFFAVYSQSVDIGTMGEPGPGFLPLWAGILLGLLSAALLAKSWFRKFEAGEPFFPEFDSWKRVSMVVLSLIFYDLLLARLGFVIITFLFVAFLVKFVFPQPWLRTVVTAVLSTAGAQIIFVNLLEIQFPKGPLGF